MSKVRVVHLTSAHHRYDARIFVKMCSSLEKQGYHTSLVVADGQGNEQKNAVNIFDVGVSRGGRLIRMTRTVNKVFVKAKQLDADIYHLHDPELIPAGLKLKKLGKKVIFDAHEDLPKQILAKPYLNKLSKIILSRLSLAYEKYSCKKFDAIITATVFIRDKFIEINKNTIDVRNFPVMKEFHSRPDWHDKSNEISYIGAIGDIRGIKEIIRSLEYAGDIKLNLCGQFPQKELKNEVMSYPGWSKVNDLGFLQRSQVAEVLANSKAGLVTLLPMINYIDALPVKMFEYMAAGIPVIASNFPLWKEVVEDNQCGICVDPLNPEMIGNAIQYLMSHPKEAEHMGINGQKAVIEKYNWDIEKDKLFEVYNKLL